MNPTFFFKRPSTLPSALVLSLFAGLVTAGALTSCGPNGAAPAAAPASEAAPTPAPPPTPTPTPLPGRVPIANWAKGKILLKVPVKPGEKVFALTFDDGPWPHSTRQILKILKEKDVYATFFMVGQEVSRRPEIAREVSAAGHAIGSHSWDHPSRPRDPVGQITRTDAVIKKAVGYPPDSFRPPYGILGNGMAKQAMKQGYPVLIWSADSADWKKPGAAHIARMIIGQASPGGIGLMHDGGGDRDQTVRALPVIIDTLRERGYRFVTIPELLAMRYVAPPAPKKPKAKPVAGKSHKKR